MDPTGRDPEGLTKCSDAKSRSTRHEKRGPSETSRHVTNELTQPGLHNENKSLDDNGSGEMPSGNRHVCLEDGQEDHEGEWPLQTQQTHDVHQEISAIELPLQLKGVCAQEDKEIHAKEGRCDQTQEQASEEAQNSGSHDSEGASPERQTAFEEQQNKQDTHEAHLSKGEDTVLQRAAGNDIAVQRQCKVPEDAGQVRTYEQQMEQVQALQGAQQGISHNSGSSQQKPQPKKEKCEREKQAFIGHSRQEKFSTQSGLQETQNHVQPAESCLQPQFLLHSEQQDVVQHKNLQDHNCVQLTKYKAATEYPLEQQRIQAYIGDLEMDLQANEELGVHRRSLPIKIPRHADTEMASMALQGHAKVATLSGGVHSSARRSTELFDSKTATALQSLFAMQVALTSEEVVVEYQKGAVEDRSHLAVDDGGGKAQKEERLQSQRKRLCQNAQAIHNRIMQQIKEKLELFKSSRKHAQHEHNDRRGILKSATARGVLLRVRRLSMLQEKMECALQSFQIRLEAVLQYRRLELLGSYGFLKRDFHATNYSLRAKIPSAARQAIGIQRGIDGPNWKLMPQALRIRLDLCRAVKDDIPRGHYVMMVSVWNRLGGHKLTWTYLNQYASSLEAGQQNDGADLSTTGGAKDILATSPCAVSAPVAFAAMYFSECLRFDETLYLNCPSEADIKPSMCLIFQLYLLRGAVSPVDKVPLFLGEVDTSIQRFMDIEDMLRTRFERWLCNLYFRVVRIPKEVDGFHEFEVPLQYTGRMLNIPDELPLPRESHHAFSLRSSRSSHTAHNSSRSNTGDHHLARCKAPLTDRLTRSTMKLSYASATSVRDRTRYSRRRKASPSPCTELWNATILQGNGAGSRLIPVFSDLLEEYCISSDMKEISLAGAALLFALGALWFAVFIALFGSWIFLKACGIPVYSAEISGLYIRLGYVQVGSNKSGGWNTTEVLMEIAYRFMAPLGVWISLLPVLLALIEGFGGESAGVTFALHNCFKRETGFGALGVALTVIMDISFVAISSMKQQVACPATAMTQRSNAYPWKHVWNQPEDLVTTYVAIFTVHPVTKQQAIYRHFLRYPDGTIDEQLYSVPLTLEFSESCCPSEVTQFSFDETGFMQHQPTKTVLSFDEWRSSRFGNMRPTVNVGGLRKAVKCEDNECIAAESEASGSRHYARSILSIDDQQALPSHINATHNCQPLHT
ncbi:ojoplano variant related protein [Cyclospora cayetanensis]|uniref:Ojoplano variant related protein n=1 Tax=Cyclospora cayetanensis TaxID=88456 RepID=A0A1D3CYV8_9EIME|nr:ojoplano variant related protein [Cyclospora cayetanensis]